MKKPVKKDLDKGTDTKTGKKDMPQQKEADKTRRLRPESPMEHDAGTQDGSGGLSGASGI